jgi:hypothetical protein
MKNEVLKTLESNQKKEKIDRLSRFAQEMGDFYFQLG